MALQFLNNGYFAGKVGIGIENPIRLLSLYSDNTETTPRLLIEQDGTGDAVMAFSLTSGQGWSMGIDNSLGDAFMIHNSASGVDSSSQFTILNSGNVGIGTTSPGAKLEIITTRTGTPSSDTNIKVTDDTAQAADVGGSINFTGKYTDAGGVLSGSPFIRASKKNSTTGDYGYGLKFGVRATGSGTSNVAMTIDSDSNVGIGTTSPDTNLEIESSTGGVLRLTSSNTTVLTDESIGKIEFKSNDASTGGNNVMGFIDSVATNVGTRYALSFGTGDAAAAVERMRITNLGGISFGSTGTAYGTSGQILKSNANASPTWIDGSTIPGVPAGSGTLNTIPLWTPDGDTLGNSIITQPSTSTIDVDGNILISDTSNDKYFGSNVNLILNADADGNSGSSARNIIFQNRGSEKMRIDSEGSVGIGTTSPSEKLHVAGNARVTGAYYDSNNSPGTANQVLISTVTGTDWVDGSGSSIIGGPYLPLAGGTMTGTNGVLMPDNFKLKFGDATTPDLEIYHDGGNSFINDTGAGALLLKSNGNGVYIKTIAGDTQAQFLNDGAVNLYYDNSFKFATTSTGVSVTGDVQIDSALLSNQENTDVDTGTETVASVAIATYTAAFFDFVIKKTTNVRSGTVYACHDGTNVEFTETSTQDLGDTSDVTLSVDISGGNMRLRATTTSDDWSVKSLIRAI